MKGITPVIAVILLLLLTVSVAGGFYFFTLGYVDKAQDAGNTGMLAALKDAKTGLLWLLAQSPILHISAKTNSAADKLVKIANASGFKNSALKSIGNKIVVEVCSTERVDSPIGKDSVLFCNKDHLELLINISNEIIKKSSLKLQKFEEKLRKDLSTHKTTIR